MDDEIISISELKSGSEFTGEERFIVNQINPSTNKFETRYATATQLYDYIKDVIFSNFNELVPVGCIKAYAAPVDTNVSIDGWLLCDGSYVVSKGIYNNLYKKIKGIYGPESSDKFKLPDLRGRIIMGYCTTGKQYTPNFGQWDSSKTLTLGAGNYPPESDFGEFRHKLIESEMPRHTHEDIGHTHEHIDVTKFSFLESCYTAQTVVQQNGKLGSFPDFLSIQKESKNRELSKPKFDSKFSKDTTPSNVNVDFAGNSNFHNNMQPHIVLNYLIKY
jgi:microcystin-dependent protein